MQMTTHLHTARRKLGSLLSTASWWLHPEPAPSFLTSYKRYRHSYTEALELAGREWGTLWDWETKLGVRGLAESVGIPTPQLLQGPVPVEGLDWSVLPEAFVIKPDRGASKKGVYVLRRTRQSSFHDLIRDREVSIAQIEKEIQSLARDGVISAKRIIAEQALLREEGAIAFDWKCYAFQGEVSVIWQISRKDGSRRSRMLDGGWRDLGNVRRGLEGSSNLPPPDHPEQILDAALRLSRAVPVPFVRVDLYESDGSVFLGELTPMPGSSQRFSRTLDKAMGEAWARAETQLMLRSTL